MSGKRVTFIGDSMAAVVQGVEEVRTLIGHSPVVVVVVGGLAVMCRLSNPYRRMVDRRRQSLRWIHDTGGTDLTLDDLDLVAELLLAACERS